MAQQENLMEELRLPKDQVDAITHPADYISSIGKDNKPHRKIFKGQEYTTSEKEAILQLKTLISQNHISLPNDWEESDYLKFIYTGKFDTKKALIALEKNLEWRKAWHDAPSNQSLELLNRGVFYQYGRDKQLRPVIILNIDLINPKNDSQETTIEALCTLLRVVQKYMFVGGKIENWVIILETNKMSFFKFPMGILKIIIQTLQVNFNATLDHLFIMHPSMSFNVVWSGVSNFIDLTSKEKIIFVSSNKEMTKLHAQIDLAQLELKYGGFREDLKLGDFWPPRNTVDKQPQDHHLIDKEFRNFSFQLDQKLNQKMTQNNQPFRSSTESNYNNKNDHCRDSGIEGERTSEQDQQRSDSKLYMVRQYSKVSRMSSSERRSFGSFHSIRTVFKSAFNSFNEEFKDVNEDFEECESKEMYYSFDDTTNIVEGGRDDWQRWTILGDEEEETQDKEIQQEKNQNNRENKLNNSNQGKDQQLNATNSIYKQQQTHSQSMELVGTKNNLGNMNNNNNIYQSSRDINHERGINTASQDASYENENSIIVQSNHRNTKQKSLQILNLQANIDHATLKNNKNNSRKSGDSYKNNVLDLGKTNKDKKERNSKRELSEQKGYFFCC